MPRLRTSRTFVPRRNFVPAFGLCEITVPFRTLRDLALVVRPNAQCEARSFALAVASDLPLTRGTTHVAAFSAKRGSTATDSVTRAAGE